MSWRPAKAITALLTQLDKLYPNRTTPDWIIGDKSHQKRKSGHNPNKHGVVRAVDIRGGGGLNLKDLTENLRESKDHRIRYLIHDRRIFASYARPWRKPWTWGRYRGSNPHTHHLHLSVSDDPRVYDRTGRWQIPGAEKVAEHKQIWTTNPLGFDAKAKVIADAQIKLLEWDPGLLPRYGVDAHLGKETQDGLREFQRTFGLDITGKLDRVTAGHLFLLR